MSIFVPLNRTDMLSGISWGEFVKFMIVCNGIYYAFIWIFIYKARLPRFANFNFRHSFHSSVEEDSSEIVKYITAEIAPFFYGRKNKNELILGLQERLKKYSDYNDTGFREAVNDFIARVSEDQCSIQMSATDLMAIWQ